MANPLLFRSACLLGSLHVVLVLLYEIPFFLALAYLCAVATSVWNHGTTSGLAKWTDRFTIVCAVIVDSMYIAVMPAAQLCLGAVLVVAGVSCYFMAKAAIRSGQSGDPYHVLSHCFGTVLNIIVIISISSQL